MPLRSTLLLPFCLLLGFLALAIAPTHAETFRNPQRIPLAVDPYGVTTGDLNGDARNDIVWTELPAYPGKPALHVLLAGANGQYTSAPDLSLPFSPTFIQCIIADVTGDKRNDLVCVAPSTNYTDVFLFTYPGKGDGTFGSPIQTKVVGQVTYSNPILAPAGDLNGDGLTDVIVMNAYYSGALPFLSDGQGGFKAATAFQGSFNFSVPTVIDLNGDGKLDVLWPTGPRVNLGKGDGTFSAIAQYDPGYLSNCAFGDVDHDGHLDAVCTFYDGGDLDGFIHLTVLHGNPDGSFNKAPLFTRTFGNGETAYDGIATILSPALIADLNNDGFADIVSLSGDGYCVLLGESNVAWNGKPQQFVAASFQSQGGLRGIYGSSIADMNGDGLPDIVAIGPNGLYITYAQSDGSLSSAPAPEVGQVSTSAALVDVNGDGNLDVVSAGDTALKLSLGHGDGTFSSPQPITSTGNFGDTNYVSPLVTAGDFNGDGKQDLLATGSIAAYTSQRYILFGRGDGTFQVPTPVSIPFGKVADLNGDGRSDIFSVQNNATSTNVLIVNLSHRDGTFTTVSTNLPVEPTGNGFVYPATDPVLADFRHSARLDVAIASKNNAYVLHSHGDGTFDSSGTVLAIPNLPNLDKLGSNDVAVADFDGDGNADLAVLSQYGNGAYDLATPTSAVWVFYGNGDGTFSAAVLAGTFNRDAQHISAVDLNGDGLADLVLTSYDVYQYNGVLIVHALPNRAWGSQVYYTGGEGLSPLWITDINHDGRNDLIFSNALRLNERASSISVLLNQSPTIVTGVLSARPEPSFVGYPFRITANLVPPTPGSVLAGTVTFLLDGAVVGTAPLSGNIASLDLSGTGVAAGIHSLSASWPGDGINPPLTLSARHAVDLLPVKVSLTSSRNPGSVGQNITFAVQVQANPALGLTAPSAPFSSAVSLYDGATFLGTQTSSSGTYSFSTSALASGTHTLTASYPGDASYASGTGSLIQTVDGLAVSMVFSAAPNPARVGAPVNLTVQLTPAGACSTCVFGGQVQFTDGPAALGNAPVTANGLATLPATFAAAGLHALSATYSGDSTNQPASATFSEQVLRADTTLTLNSSANPATAGSAVTFTAHITPASPVPNLAGSPITVSDGSKVLASVTTDASGTAITTLTSLAVGTHTINAALAQNETLNPGSTSISQEITPAVTHIALSGSPDPVYQYQSLAFVIKLDTPPSFPASGTVQLLDGNVSLATLSVTANGATFSTNKLSVGVHSLTALYPGDSSTLPATSSPLVVTVLASDFLLTSMPATLTVKTEHHLTFSVAAQSIGAFADQLTFSMHALPAHMQVDFASPTATLASGATYPISVYMDTDDVLGYARATPPQPEQVSQSSPFWALLPAPIFILSICRFRSRRGLKGLMLLICLLIPLSGCSSLYPKSTPPGVYTLQVQAVGTRTGLVHTLNVQVTVTP